LLLRSLLTWPVLPVREGVNARNPEAVWRDRRAAVRAVRARRH
jgi:hypothetical protein